MAAPSSAPPSSATPSSASAPSAQSVRRPLSPHLSIYRPQLTSGMSIFHKITGVGIAGGLVVLIAWLACLAWLPTAWSVLFIDVATSWIGRLFLFGWSWAFFYHLGCGIRHLLWHAGLCLSLPWVYGTGYVVLAFSVLAPLALWTYILVGA